MSCNMLLKIDIRWWLDGHESIFDTCKELGVTYVAFSPMANGALTGVYKSNKEFKNDGSDFRVKYASI